MTKFSNKLKKPCFWPILGPLFPIFWEKKFSSRTASHGLLAPCRISEKTNDTIPRKCLDRRTDKKTEGQTDWQAYFIGPFLLLLQVEYKDFVLCLFVLYWTVFVTDLFWNVLFQTFDYFWKQVPTKLLISMCWHILHQI